MTPSGSSKALAALVVLFLLTFWLQRCRSEFLNIEAEVGLARQVAVETGLSVVEVMALRELLGTELDEEQLNRAAVRYARLDARYGAPLAALAVAGHEPLVDAELAAAAGDPVLAWRRLRSRPEAVAAVRFKAVAERLASRSAGRRN